MSKFGNQLTSISEFATNNFKTQNIYFMGWIIHFSIILRIQILCIIFFSMKGKIEKRKLLHSILQMLELWNSLCSKLWKLLRMFMAAAQQLLLLLAIIAFWGKCKYLRLILRLINNRTWLEKKMRQSSHCTKNFNSKFL